MGGAARRALRLVAGTLLGLLVRAWVRTLRIRVSGERQLGGGALVAFWHGEQLPLLGALPPGHPVVALVSRSADGELSRAALRALGVGACRGSSSSGGAVGLRGLLRALGDGALVALAVDGPRGPMGTVKPGAAWLGRRAPGGLHAAAVCAPHAWRLRRAWDRFLVPRPFTRVGVGVVKVSGEVTAFELGVALEQAARHARAAAARDPDQALA